jgi:hypothetical protein
MMGVVGQCLGSIESFNVEAFAISGRDMARRQEIMLTSLVMLWLWNKHASLANCTPGFLNYLNSCLCDPILSTKPKNDARSLRLHD